MSSSSAIISYSDTFFPDEKLNFSFPVPETMETSRVKLVPFDGALHSAALFSGTHSTDTFVYMLMGPYDSQSDLSVDFTSRWGFGAPRTATLFAVFDTTQPSGEEMAGVIAYTNAAPVQMSIDIGPLITFHKFRGSHVTASAVGLLTHYALDLPQAGGLGLRRVVYHANALNTGSIRLAERLGFRKEGVSRWTRTQPSHKPHAVNGIELRKGDPRSGELGSDTATLSMCWDEWESDGRETTDAQMERRK